MLLQSPATYIAPPEIVASDMDIENLFTVTLLPMIYTEPP